jgi:hypothetical protein
MSSTTDGHEWTQIPNSVLLSHPSFPSRPSREIIPENVSRRRRRVRRGANGHRRIEVAAPGRTSFILHLCEFVSVRGFNCVILLSRTHAVESLELRAERPIFRGHIKVMQGKNRGRGERATYNRSTQVGDLRYLGNIGPVVPPYFRTWTRADEPRDRTRQMTIVLIASTAMQPKVASGCAARCEKSQVKSWSS